MYQVSLAQIGVESEAEAHDARAEVSEQADHASQDGKDYFVERNGLRFAGSHLIIDFFEAHRLDSVEAMQAALLECVRAARATLLHIHLHHFEPNGGVSGVAVLAESHISVHSWPERGYAAFDVFMCGGADPHATIEVLRRHFRPGRARIAEQLRGIL